jgi:hypothetical protein
LASGWYVWQLSKPFPFKNGESDATVDAKSEAWRFFLPPDKENCILTFQKAKDVLVYTVPSNKTVQISTKGLTQDRSRERVVCNIFDGSNQPIGDFYIPLRLGDNFIVELATYISRDRMKKGEIIYLKIDALGNEALFLKLAL